MASEPRPVLVVDLGAQYAQLIARRVREAHVYSEIVAHDVTADEVRARRPAGLILSGGPASVYADGAPQVDPGLFELGVPVLGICYGHQLMARALGGEVAATGQREYGATSLSLDERGGGVLAAGPAGDRDRLDVARRRGDPGARRLPGDGAHRADPDRGHGGPVARHVRGAVPPRGHAHRARPGRDEALPLRGVRPAARLDADEHHRRPGRAHPGAGGRRAGAVRAERWRRLRGCRAARAPGDRRSAHMRVRRPRARTARASPIRSRRRSRATSRCRSCT